jgi:hypothetical protein
VLDAGRALDALVELRAPTSPARVPTLKTPPSCPAAASVAATTSPTKT